MELTKMGFGKDGKGVIICEQRSQAIGALAAQTALLIGTKLAMAEDFRMLKSIIHAHLEGLTAGEGNRLIFGLAEGNLTVAEIGEHILAGGPLFREQVPECERALRPVFILGAGETENLNTEAQIVDMETGAPVVVAKPRWTFSNDSGWNFFVFNNSGAAMTTGATLYLLAKDFGVWLQ